MPTDYKDLSEAEMLQFSRWDATIERLKEQNEKMELMLLRCKAQKELRLPPQFVNSPR